MSGGEPSSIKQMRSGRERLPALNNVIRPQYSLPFMVLKGGDGDVGAYDLIQKMATDRLFFSRWSGPHNERFKVSGREW